MVPTTVSNTPWNTLRMALMMPDAMERRDWMRLVSAFDMLISLWSALVLAYRQGARLLARGLKADVEDVTTLGGLMSR